jgi:hypothetical protein
MVLEGLLAEVRTPYGAGVFERKLSYEDVVVYAYRVLERPSLVYTFTRTHEGGGGEWPRR